GFLLAAEGAANLRAAGAGIDVGDAAIAPPNAEELLGLAKIVRENAGAAALRHAVVHRNRIRELLVRDQVKQGSKGLLLHDGEVVGRFGKAGRDVAVPGQLQRLAAEEDLPAFAPHS